ncbi:hypothetical protein L484_009246 [Morus notabilis]|uniref:Transmembrane protein 135 N-terminal domain-containing protein n=1 Tax=Morus notabilis TaxID=981085 RepID=W9S3V2_9ROSA|nr:hypothetical protein L484_009246 [Morus notabilis]
MSPPPPVSFGNCASFPRENGSAGVDHRESGDATSAHCNGGSDLSASSSSGGVSVMYCDFPFNDSEKLRRVVTASAKGFSIGAGLKGGLALFSILARLRRRKALAYLRKEGAITNSEAIVMAVKETLRYGLFLSTFAGTFVSVDEIIASLGVQTDKFASSILVQDSEMEGCVSRGYCGTVDASYWARNAAYESGYIHSYASCRASLALRDQKQTIRPNLQATHLGARSAYILKQDSLPPSYKSFLNKHGGKDIVILKAVKEIASGMPFTNLQAVEKYYNSVGVDIKLDPNMKVPCSIVHGNQSCSGHIFSFLVQAYKRALPVYLPVYLIPALIVHRQGLLKRPYTILGKGLFGTARSSLFLSVYCSSAWAWTCFLFRIFKKCNIPMVAMGTFPTGLALAIEKKTRRMEISLYCLARAIESFFTCLADAGYLLQSKNLKRADVVVFSLSTAIIMHCYAQEREVFRSKYLNVLDWFLIRIIAAFYFPPHRHVIVVSTASWTAFSGDGSSGGDQYRVGVKPAMRYEEVLQQTSIPSNRRKLHSVLAAAVIQRMQALSRMIRRKASVCGFFKSIVNLKAQLWTDGGNYQARVRILETPPSYLADVGQFVSLEFHYLLSYAIALKAQLRTPTPHDDDRSYCRPCDRNPSGENQLPRKTTRLSKQRWRGESLTLQVAYRSGGCLQCRH